MLEPNKAVREARILNRRNAAENYRNALHRIRTARIVAFGFVLGAGLLSGFLTILMRL